METKQSLNHVSNKKYFLTFSLSILFLFISVVEFVIIYKIPAQNYTIKYHIDNTKIKLNGTHVRMDEFPPINPYHIQIYDDNGKLMKDEDLKISPFLPKNGVVKDYKTAMKLAEIIWYPLYGDIIYTEQPFNTILVKDSIWIVTGTLTDNRTGSPSYIEIRKFDGKVLTVTHEK